MGVPRNKVPHVKGPRTGAAGVTRVDPDHLGNEGVSEWSTPGTTEQKRSKYPDTPIEFPLTKT